jgi:2-polyprenyl-3-methyl-5-hydroxy-6-metoxy-1,4-benzoquinol methylase
VITSFLLELNTYVLIFFTSNKRSQRTEFLLFLKYTHIYISKQIWFILTQVRSYFDSHAHLDIYAIEADSCSVHINHIKRIIGLDEGIRILDVGCGNGVFIKTMINNGLKADFMGLDISSAMIAMAKKYI